MFRVRVGFLSGNCILQVSRDGKWVDAEPRKNLVEGFHIIGRDWYTDNEGVIAILKARVDLYERRAATAKRGRAKKKLPVLVEVV